MMTFVLIVCGVIIVLFLSFVILCIVKVRQQDTILTSYNENEWHIDKIAKPIYLIRLINAVGCGCGSSCFASTMLFLIDRLLVQRALRKSLKTMKIAEARGTVPPILCDRNARNDFQRRVEEYYADIYGSQSMTVFSKLLNYAAAYDCMSNHRGLLELGMAEDVANEIVKQPVFIVSNPRTGTTILHRTMSLDTARFRNFDLCDMMLPLPKPIPRWDVEGRENLAKRGNKLFDQLKAILPGFNECMETMHGFRLDEADEDIGWYDKGIGHLFIDVLIKLHPECRSKPMGMSSLESKEFAKYRFAWLEMIMKIYQNVDKVEWIKKSEDEEAGNFRPSPTEHLPWLMKDPNHSAYLPELLERFLDAKLIFTHRAPGEIVASMAKLFVILTSVEHIPGAVGTSAQEWGQETNLRMKYYVDGMVDFTKNQDNPSLGIQKVGKKVRRSTSTRRIDFYFKNVVQDIPGTIQNVYKQFYPNQPPPSETAMEAFKVYLEKNEREKHGNQRRSLEDFHLTEDDVAYTEYHDLFLDTLP